MLVTRLAQQVARTLRIIWVLHDAAVVGPIVGRQHSCRRPRLTSPQVFDDLITIDTVGERLANTNIPEYGVRQVECHVLIVRSIRLHYFQLRILLQNLDRIRRQDIQSNVNRAFPKLERSDNIFRDDSKAKSGYTGAFSEVRIVPLKDDFLVLDVSNQLERA